MGEVEEITMDLTETKNELNQILQEDEKDRMQLRVIEVAYIQKYGYEIGSPEANKLFPLGWFEDCDYNDKIAIIAEAIANDKKIIETKLYQARIEGVKTR